MLVQNAERLEFQTKGKHMKNLWHGKLKEDNLNDVANKISEMLHNKQYTFLVASKINDYRPTIYRNLQLESENPLSFRDDSFKFSDSYGTWSCPVS